MISIDRDRLEASICRDSFYAFVQRFWHEVVPEDPIWNWHIEVLCDYLQEAAERVFRGEPKEHDLLCNIPPGTTKSTIASVMFPAWVWTRMPTARTICSSYSTPLSLVLSRRCRDVVQSDRWRRLFPGITLRKDQSTKSYFENEQGGWRYSTSTNGTVTGFHGHFIIIDDPLDPNRAVSDAELANANHHVSETLPTRKVDKIITVTMLIMQRLHQNDPSAVMLEKSKQTSGAKVRHINLPAEVEGNGLDQVRPRKLASFYRGGLLDPVRMPREVLDQLRVALGEHGYSGQMLQRPVPRGGAMFKVDRITLDQHPPLRHFKGLVRYWDKAGTQDGGAFTAGVFMGLDARGRYWILDVVKGQWESHARERVILQTAQLDGVKVEVGVEQEPGSGGKESAQATVRNLAGFKVRVDRPTGDKVIRADPFSVQVNGENVMMKPGPWNGEYLDELRHFPHSKYKDQVDASSGAFLLLTKPRLKAGGLW